MRARARTSSDMTGKEVVLRDLRRRDLLGLRENELERDLAN